MINTHSTPSLPATPKKLNVTERHSNSPPTVCTSDIHLNIAETNYLNAASSTIVADALRPPDQPNWRDHLKLFLNQAFCIPIIPIKEPEAKELTEKIDTYNKQLHFQNSSFSPANSPKKNVQQSKRSS